MLDTLAVAQGLTEAGLQPAQAAAITYAIQRAVERGDHVTSDQSKAGLAELRTEIVNVESRLIKCVVGTAVAAAVAGAGITTVLLRLLGE